MSVSINNFEEI